MHTSSSDSLRYQPDLNVRVTEDDRNPSDPAAQALSDLWRWIQSELVIHGRYLIAYMRCRFSRYSLCANSSFAWIRLLLSRPPGHLGELPAHRRQLTLTPSSPPDETPLAIQRSLLLDLPVADALHKRTGSSGSRGHSARRERSPADDLHGELVGCSCNAGQPAKH